MKPSMPAFLSDRTGIPEDAIRIVQGDSDRIARGGGTGGSRSVTVQTNAIKAAVTRCNPPLRLSV
jgi:aerobic carbon-monoxide dehydrogenase large subunit